MYRRLTIRWKLISKIDSLRRITSNTRIFFIQSREIIYDESNAVLVSGVITASPKHKYAKIKG
jgi:hypothetical protein